ADQSAVGRQVVRVATQMRDGCGPIGRPGEPVACSADVAEQPRTDVATAGHRRQIVHATEQIELLEFFQNTQIERRTPDAAARKSQPDEVVQVSSRANSLAPAVSAPPRLVRQRAACAAGWRRKKPFATLALDLVQLFVERDTPANCFRWPFD